MADLDRKALLLGAILLATAAVALRVWRRHERAGRPVTRQSEDGDPVSTDRVSRRLEREWTCQCGHRYRFSGEGRHRVYWLADADADASQAIVDGHCPHCQHALPGTHESQGAPQDEISRPA